MKLKMTYRLTALLLLLVLAFALVACGEEETPKEEGKAEIYTLTYKGTNLTLGADANGVLSALGAYQSKTEIGDCGGLGAQVKYSYPSFYVYVLESDAKGNIIDQITFRDDVVTTPEGVYIGMSAEQAKQKLGEPSAQSDTALEYQKDSFLLRLVIKDGAVEQIDYMTVTQ